MQYELPKVVQRYLDSQGLVVVSQEDIKRWQDDLEREKQKTCRYELFETAWGWSHERYVGTICEKEDDFSHGLHVVQCSACGHVSFQTPVAYA